jgi:hypothetical protein
LTGLLRHVLRSEKKAHEDMLPGEVVAYDRATNLATIQPMIKILTTNNTLVSRGQNTNVPVFAYGGGGFVISFPVKAGDKGWIKANDRDISLYMQAQAEAGPNTQTLHSFNNAMFFPDAMQSFTINEADEASLVIQSLDGTTRFVMGSNSIKMYSGTLTHNDVDISAVHVHGNGNDGENTTAPVA